MLGKYTTTSKKENERISARTSKEERFCHEIIRGIVA